MHNLRGPYKTMFVFWCVGATLILLGIYTFYGAKATVNYIDNKSGETVTIRKENIKVIYPMENYCVIQASEGDEIKVYNVEDSMQSVQEQMNNSDTVTLKLKKIEQHD